MLFSISYENTEEDISSAFSKMYFKYGKKRVFLPGGAYLIVSGICLYFLFASDEYLRYGLIWTAATFCYGMIANSFRAVRKRMLKKLRNSPKEKITLNFYKNRFDIITRFEGNGEIPEDNITVGRDTEEIYFEELSENKGIYVIFVNRRICLAVPKRELDSEKMKLLEEYFSVI